MLGLVKARRLLGMMERTERRFGVAPGLDIQALWKPYFCIATNYSRATELVLDLGPLVPAVMATCAIPGAMPPVLRDGDLLCDGGVFNNLPVDAAAGRQRVDRHHGHADLGPRRPKQVQEGWRHAVPATYWQVSSPDFSSWNFSVRHSAPSVLK
jgi:NTE family protein